MFGIKKKNAWIQLLLQPLQTDIHGSPRDIVISATIKSNCLATDMITVT